jgi:hypothetical protein
MNDDGLIGQIARIRLCLMFLGRKYRNMHRERDLYPERRWEDIGSSENRQCLVVSKARLLQFFSKKLSKQITFAVVSGTWISLQSWPFSFTRDSS